MRKLVLSCLFLLLCTAALATPAKDETVDALLIESRMESTMQTMYSQLGQYLEDSMLAGIKEKEAAKGKEPTAAQIRYIKAVAAELAQMFREEMNWTQMRPMFVRIYKEALTEEEVQSMLDFYRTPGGKALVEKMPILAQKSMAYVQERMPALIQRMGPTIAKAVKDAQAK